MAKAAIGPGMAIYSAWSAVRSADGQALSVREALGMINAALDEALDEINADMDNETRFAVGWFEQHGWREGGFWRCGQFGAGAQHQRRKRAAGRAGRGGRGQGAADSILTIMTGGAYDPRRDDRCTAWEAAHHLIYQLRNNGVMHGASPMYNKLLEADSAVADAVPDLTYKLYNLCDRQNRSADAMPYNELMASWADINEQAAIARAMPEQSDMDM